MSIVSKLTIPVLLGGIAALMASGIFSPPVYAQSGLTETIAQLNHAHGAPELNVRLVPSGDAQTVATIRSSAWVWLDHCVDGGEESDWCLVERGAVKGWVRSAHVTPHWD